MADPWSDRIPAQLTDREDNISAPSADVIARIVQALAEYDPYEDVGSFHQCFFCCQPEPAQHLADCIWLQAQDARWVNDAVPSPPPEEP